MIILPWPFQKNMAWIHSDHVAPQIMEYLFPIENETNNDYLQLSHAFHEL